MTAKELIAVMKDWNGVYCPPGLPAMAVNAVLAQLKTAEAEVKALRERLERVEIQRRQLLDQFAEIQGPLK